MTQSFEDWNKYNLGYTGKQAFEAGQQSKQAEIDELQRKYDAMYNAFTYSDDCRKEWHESFMRSKEREDELRKRIDEALRFYNDAKSPHNIGMIQMAIYLKGTTK